MVLYGFSAKKIDGQVEIPLYTHSYFNNDNNDNNDNCQFYTLTWNGCKLPIDKQ